MSALFQVLSRCRQAQHLTPNPLTTQAHPIPTSVDGGTGALAMDTNQSTYAHILNYEASPHTYKHVYFA